MKFHASALAAVIALAGVPSSDAFQRGETLAAPPKLSEPPTAFKWPIVGTLPDFFSRGGVDGMLDVYESMYHDYGEVFGQSLMGADEFCVADPNVFDQILRQEGKFPVGAAEGVTTFTDYYKENDLKIAIQANGRGPEWKEWRSATNPDLFVLWDTYLPVIAETCAKISSLAGKEVTETKNIHVADFLSRSAFDMFSAVLFGESPETTNSEKAKKDDVEFVTSTKKAFDITGSLMSNPMEKAFGSNLYKEFVYNMDNTFNFAREVAMEKISAAVELQDTHKMKVEEEQKLAAASSEDQSESSDSASGCPVTAIKNTFSNANNSKKKVVPTEFVNPSFIERQVSRGKFQLDEISEQAAPLLMAGVDTTAYVMNWFYLNMASNPDVQTKLAKELKEKLNGADVTTVEQMQSLTYLKACFRESHRLTPISPMSTKTLDKDANVVTEGKTYKIPAGQRISLNLRAFPMDPQFVEDPKSFVPERFLPEAVAARKGTTAAIALDHPYVSDPFGRGKRRCLGANVAIAEMTVLAARLLQDWEIKLVDPNEAIQSTTKTWQPKQKLMQIADPYPAMEFVPRKQ